MKKNNLHYAFAILLLPFIIYVFLPYFTDDFSDLRQEKENKAEEQRLLEEARLVKEKEEKIYLMGRFEPKERPEFSLVPLSYTLAGNEVYLRGETLEAFRQMRDTALLEGVDLKIASATRNFDYQKGIWENKWTGVTFVEGKNLAQTLPSGLERFKKILEYSAAPGISRHHWGTDIDINAATVKYFETETGKRVYEWLDQNALRFGFCQTYNEKDSVRFSGYNEEKWHWSYLPLARGFTKRFQELIKEEDIKGFLGDEYVSEQSLIADYVLGINSECI